MEELERGFSDSAAAAENLGTAAGEATGKVGELGEGIRQITVSGGGAPPKVFQVIADEADATKTKVQELGRAILEAQNVDAIRVQAEDPTGQTAGDTGYFALIDGAVTKAAKSVEEVEKMAAETRAAMDQAGAAAKTAADAFGVTEQAARQAGEVASQVGEIIARAADPSSLLAGIGNLARTGFATLRSEIASLAASVNQMIADILAALRRAAAEAARLRAAASGGGGRGGGGEPGFALGGRFSGRGTGTSDSNLIRISDGEFIVNARATREFLPLLYAINGMRISMADLFAGFRGFNLGGLVGGLERSMASLMPPPIRMASGGLVPAAAGARTPVHLHLPGGGEVVGMFEPEDVTELLTRGVTRKSIRSAGRSPGWRK